MDQSCLDDIKGEVMDKLEVGCQQGAVLINNDHINPLTPIRTGNLRDGNTFDVERGEDEITITFHNEVPYDLFVNDGTVHMFGRHYREIGAHEGLSELTDAIEAILGGSSMATPIEYNTEFTQEEL